ncbi:8466_t:CDS:2 [Ambispora gerdemannii]|uniref:8466_t:CDS:1 n=1 Tax=Ambispora gerdemannii TaxID=144530 RepID=A0A9N9A806_9GLOM|nr:8466_t:CDS:2 [Ambispora gerdemannii]
MNLDLLLEHFYRQDKQAITDPNANQPFNARTIRSATYDNVYLRCDGSGVNEFKLFGGGVVNAQYGAGEYEKFNFIPQEDGSYAIQSSKFQNYLRVQIFVPRFNSNGTGTVNVQNNIIRQPDDSYAIQSKLFRTFLRLDGRQVTSYNDAGSGLVNVQRNVRDMEKFIIEPPLTHSTPDNNDRNSDTTESD